MRLHPPESTTATAHAAKLLVPDKPRATLAPRKEENPAAYALVEGERIVYVEESVRTLRQRTQNY
jgi:hypothetical protein